MTSPEETQQPDAETSPQEENMERLLESQDALLDRLLSKEVVWAKVVALAEDQVLVDIGGKSEGFVPLAEFHQETGTEAPPPPAPGQRIPVLWSGRDRDGTARLSFRRAKAQLSWEAAVKAFRDKGRVHGRVVKAVKGGFLVEVGGVEAFLPASLADLYPVRTPEQMLGTGVRAYIIELDEKKKRLVISRRAVLEEEALKRREKALQELRIGEIRGGRVRRMGVSGLVVDLGGLDGLVRPQDLCWGSSKLAPAYKRGDRVRVKVLGKPAPAPARSQTPEAQAAPAAPARPEEELVSLGIKQLLPNPADKIKKKYPARMEVTGKILSCGPEGLRLELADATKAFCPASEMDAEARYEAGESVRAVVTGLGRETFEVWVSVARYEEKKDRERTAKYLKPPKPLTLGELLSPAKTTQGPHEPGGAG